MGKPLIENRSRYESLLNHEKWQFKHRTFFFRLHLLNPYSLFIASRLRPALSNLARLTDICRRQIMYLIHMPEENFRRRDLFERVKSTKNIAKYRIKPEYVVGRTGEYPRGCINCYAVDKATKKCKGCATIGYQYCSRECQLLDWPFHKVDCIRKRKDAKKNSNNQ